MHISLIEGKDPKTELNTCLLQYRSMPHITTGKSPAKLLFVRWIQSKLPQFHPQTETKEIDKIRRHHDMNKILQKDHADKRPRSKLTMINEGDKVLIKQNKSTTRPPFDPKPFHVVKVKGSQLTMKHGNQTRIRDKGHIKLVQGASPTPDPKLATESSSAHLKLRGLRHQCKLDIDQRPGSYEPH